MSMTLTEIETKTKAYADARASLSATVCEMDSEMKAVKQRFAKRLAKHVGLTKDSKALLVSALEGNKTLFVKPRTYTFDGVKVGFTKSKGKIVITDEANTIKLIRKHLPEQADLLIRSIESPVKDAIDQLLVTDLKRIGCTVKEATDCVVIAEAKSDLDKLINALLTEDKADEQ